MTGGVVVTRSALVSVMAAALVAVSGCDLVDPARPAAHPDAMVFGNLLEVSRSEDDPALWTARIRVGAPRALLAAEEESGKPTPIVEKGLVATVTVNTETVVILRDVPTALDEIDPGTEVAVVPVPGTTQMIGSSDVRLDANTFMDFVTYQRWRLPGLGLHDGPEADHPDLVNSSGAEIAPVPLAGGKVLYFAAHLRSPVSGEDSWHGARREGLTVPEEGELPRERSFRTELTESGWTSPSLVQFPELEEADRVRVTWVSADESRCLVTVASEGEPSWVGLATRQDRSEDWGTPERIDVFGSDARDAVYLTGSLTKAVFVSTRTGAQSDLFLYDPGNEQSPLPLQPQICTLGNEWNPRTGPQNELFFCREDRQLIFAGGRVRALRLPGPHRAVFTQAAPTDDGRWLFMCLPRYRPVEHDEDIYVAPLLKDFALGRPVPVDDWRP